MMKLNGVFEGGGAKGIALGGALQRAEEEGVEFIGLAGTSAGSIVASLYAVGYSATQLKALLDRTDFAALLDPPWSKTINLWNKYGIHKGQKLYEWVYKLLYEKGVVTFQDVQRDLKVIASDLTNKQILIFDKASHPDLLIAEAVRMSVSIPLFFEAYQWGKRLVVDGGLLSNYPIWAFTGSPFPTLGFRLVSKEKTAVPGPPTSFPTFLVSLVSTMLEAHDKEYERSIGAEQTIHIPTGEIATTKFGLTEHEKTFLYDSGYRAASEFINKGRFFQQLRAGATGKVGAKTTPSIQGRLYESLERLQTVEEDQIERAFKMTEVRRKLVVNRPDAELEVAEEGVNMSDDPQSWVGRRMVADTPADFNQLNFQAWCKEEEDECEAAVTSESSEDGRTHKVRIGFKGRPVHSGRKLQFRWRFRWPGAVARNEDYWAFPVNYYALPVGVLVIDVSFVQSPADLGFFAATESGLKPVDISGPVLRQDSSGDTLYVYSTRIDLPSGVYLLRWRLS